ncbi:MAG: hypothetical protein WC410_00485 [Candidatus Paceibacterota bacterium]|jgi:hypothetical protein
MDYSFGDILDGRSTPGIDHFILVVGELSIKNKPIVMYYKITSRVYAVFKDILKFFNDCISRGDAKFLRCFSKEKNKEIIVPHGPLCQAVFLDRDSDYPLVLDLDSMVVLNQDPELIDKEALETLKKDGKITYRIRLTKSDTFNLINSIKFSNTYMSPDKINKISHSFNQIKNSL